MSDVGCAGQGGPSSIFAVLNITSGDEGMALVARFGVDLPMPHLVILDLNMPGYSGFDIRDEIRTHDVFARVPIVFMSGSLNSKDAEAALVKGGGPVPSKAP